MHCELAPEGKARAFQENVTKHDVRYMDRHEISGTDTSSKPYLYHDCLIHKRRWLSYGRSPEVITTPLRPCHEFPVPQVVQREMQRANDFIAAGDSHHFPMSAEAVRFQHRDKEACVFKGHDENGVFRILLICETHQGRMHSYFSKKKIPQAHRFAVGIKKFMDTRCRLRAKLRRTRKRRLEAISN